MGSLTAHFDIPFPLYFCFYLLKDFAKFKVRYEFDAKQIEPVATDIKKELTKDLLM